MASPVCERAIEDATDTGRAILKYIQPNNVGATGSNEAGFYLPKSIHALYTDIPPIKGVVKKQAVKVHWWQIGLTTPSNVTWYGKKTRSEYRLTGFGKGFPYLQADCIGDLLVIIPHTFGEFTAYVLDQDDDIEEVQTALGLDITQSWGAYQDGNVTTGGSTTGCIRKHSRDFLKLLDDKFPGTDVFSETARAILEKCVTGFKLLPPDDALKKCLDTEFEIFKLAERQLCSKDISRLFQDVDDFVKTAHRIINRRKVRAGRSLENHVDHLLTRENIRHEMRPGKIRGQSDIIIPGAAEYNDPAYPLEKLCVVGVKTTCKDRWRQVLQEAPRVRKKHLLTTQHGISIRQMDEMHEAGITLIVPEKLHKKYEKGSKITLLNFEEFIGHTRTIMAA